MLHSLLSTATVIVLGGFCETCDASAIVRGLIVKIHRLRCIIKKKKRKETERETWHDFRPLISDLCVYKMLREGLERVWYTICSNTVEPRLTATSDSSIPSLAYGTRARSARGSQNRAILSIICPFTGNSAFRLCVSIYPVERKRLKSLFAKLTQINTLSIQFCRLLTLDFKIPA